MSSRRGSREEQILVEICLPNQVEANARQSEDLEDLDDQNISDGEDGSYAKASFVTWLLISAISPVIKCTLALTILTFYMVFLGLHQVTFIVGWMAVISDTTSEGDFLVGSVCYSLALYTLVSTSYLSRGNVPSRTRMDKMSYLILIGAGLPTMVFALGFLIPGFLTDGPNHRLVLRAVGMALHTLSLVSVTFFWVFQIADYKVVLRQV